MNYFKQCTGCAEWKDSPEFSVDASSSDGFSRRCRGCMKIAWKKNYARNGGRIRNKRRMDSRTCATRFYMLKRVARRRGLSCTLTYDEYRVFASRSCHYCGGALGKSESGSGLDRVDNKRGYDADNVLPCCGVCNRVRSDEFTVEETMEMIRAVVGIRKKFAIAV